MSIKDNLFEERLSNLYFQVLQKCLNKEKYPAMPQLLRQSWKFCKSKKERIILRICKLIASNIVKKALYLMKKHDIDINIILISRLDEDIVEEPLDPKKYFDINFNNCAYQDNIHTTCETFLSVACNFSNFQTIELLCKAGANPFRFADHKEITSILNCNHVIVIPQILKIFNDVKPIAKSFFQFSILNKIQTFTDKGRFSLMNKIILFDKKNNVFENNFKTIKRFEQLFKNQGISKKLIEMDLNLATKLVHDKNFFPDYFYIDCCHKFKISYINTYKNNNIVNFN